ncbi:MAG TPA: enoyl-CoA hydratase-related protein [Chloroflexota bacterium]|nr:enoyl-CoA hydratase-related protein [Chloroflexota bacterium]
MAYPEAPGLRIGHDAPVLTIAFDRPAQRNSFTPSIAAALRDTLIISARDPDLRVVLLSGSGGEAFSAGYDIAALAELAEQGLRPLEDGDPYEQANQALLRHPLPTVAMLQGWVMGGGCALATGCDIRIAGDSARFGMPTAKLGVLYGYHDFAPFLEAVGQAWTRFLFLTGHVIDASTALRIGLVHEVVPDNELEEVTQRLVSEIAENAPLSVKGTKRVLGLMRPEIDGLSRAEIERLMQRTQSSADLEEGRQAFLEKRRPRFQGR